MTAAEFRPFDIASAFVYATVSLNGKRREQKRAGSRGGGGTGGRENCISLAWRDAAEHARRKSGVAAPGGWEVFALGPERLCRCGNNPPSLRNGERERKNSIVSARFYTNVCVRIDEYIFPSRKNSSMLQNLSTIWLIVYIIKASDHVKRRSNKSNQEKEGVINLIT